MIHPFCAIKQKTCLKSKSLFNPLFINALTFQARTLEYQKRTPIQLSTFGMIILAATMAGIFLLCSIVLILGIRYRRMRHENDSPSELKTHDFPEMPEMPELPELPEEFITYRHFSLPSTENIYS